MSIFGCPPGVSGLVAHAEAIDQLRAAWGDQGLSAAVHCRPGDAARWMALTGIERHQPGRRADVLIVDRADRLPSRQLIGLLAETSPGRELILVEGGTMPRLTLPASRGFAEVGDRLGRFPVNDQGLGNSPRPGGGREALTHLVRSWAQKWPGAEAATLVGLGVDEVAALNRAARQELVQARHLHGPEVVAAGRAWQAGDRVLALHGTEVGRAAGAAGRVTRVQPDTATANVSWDDGGTSTVRGRQARALGYAYAVLPSMAARMGTPVLLLGSEEALPSLRGLIIDSAAATPQIDRGLQRRRSAAIGLEI